MIKERSYYQMQQTHGGIKVSVELKTYSRALEARKNKCVRGVKNVKASLIANERRDSKNGFKESQILEAQAEKESQILRATGQAEAIIMVQMQRHKVLK